MTPGFLTGASRQVGGRPRRGNVDIDFRAASGEHPDTEECEQPPWDRVMRAKEKGEGERSRTILDRRLKTCKEQADEGEPGEAAEKPEREEENQETVSRRSQGEGRYLQWSDSVDDTNMPRLFLSVHFKFV